MLQPDQDQSGDMKDRNGNKIKPVDSFKYLRTFAKRDVYIRLGKTWGVLHSLNIIWKANLPENLKINFF